MGDIRVSFSWADNLKTRKLDRQLGRDGLLSLLFLWIYAGENCPDGILLMPAEDVELAARWEGEAGVFVESLLQVAFLDKLETGYQLHDWAEHQPYLVGAPERRKQAVHAAQRRWNKAPKDADGMLSACSEHADGYAPTLPDLTSPDQTNQTNPPHLLPADAKLAEPDPCDEPESTQAKAEDDDDPQIWINESWMNATGKRPSAVIADRIRELIHVEGYSPEEVQDAIKTTGESQPKSPLRYCQEVLRRARAERAETERQEAEAVQEAIQEAAPHRLDGTPEWEQVEQLFQSAGFDKPGLQLGPIVDLVAGGVQLPHIARVLEQAHGSTSGEYDPVGFVLSRFSN